MRVLVLGSTGMLGVATAYQLRKCGLDVVTRDKRALDALNPDFSQLDGLGVQYVINAIGLINRRAHRPESEFLAVNSLFPRRLADYCVAHGVRLIHVSTDCVFRGDAGPYNESSPAKADDLYGRSKLWGEPSNAMVIRSSFFGPELHNHYCLLSWLLMQSGDVTGYTNHLWNGVTTLEFGRIIAKIIENDLFTYGIRHIYGEDLSKYELLKMIEATYQSGANILPTTAEPARDTRLSTMHLDTRELLRPQAMPDQLKDLRAVSDARGWWTASGDDTNTGLQA